jgi:hypothetical protein
VVECHLAKVDVEGSNPFSRSKKRKNEAGFERTLSRLVRFRPLPSRVLCAAPCAGVDEPTRVATGPSGGTCGAVESAAPHLIPEDFGTASRRGGSSVDASSYRPRMHRRFLLVAFVSTLFVLFSSVGCKSKKTLDADVDHLLVAVASSDYDHFKADAHPALAKEVTKQEFDEIARVLKKLGPLKSKTMTSIQVKSGEPTQGKYTLEFTNGSCALDIKSLDGKLVGFHFTGPDIARLKND